MVFGRRARDDELRDALLDATARFEARSREDAERYQQTQLQMLESMDGLRAQLVNRDTEMMRAIGQLGELCSAIAQRMELERIERRELVQVLGNVARAIAKQEPYIAVPDTTSHVIGGTIFGDASVTDVTDITDDAVEVEMEETDLDVTTVLAARHASGSLSAVVEVRCRFGDRWVDGFEVCDVVAQGNDLRYRLRRRSDGSVLPRLFAAEELRAVSSTTTTNAATTTQTGARRGWSELSD